MKERTHYCFTLNGWPLRRLRQYAPRTRTRAESHRHEFIHRSGCARCSRSRKQRSNSRNEPTAVWAGAATRGKTRGRYAGAKRTLRRRVQHLIGQVPENAKIGTDRYRVATVQGADFAGPSNAVSVASCLALCSLWRMMKVRRPHCISMKIVRKWLLDPRLSCGGSTDC
jgi:hypothetical protein